MATSDSVTAMLVYNAFDPQSCERVELAYEDGKTIAEYIEGLPDTCDWKIGYNGVPVDPADYKEVVPEAGSVISVVSIPRGGDDEGKSILRMVAILVVMAVAFVALGPIGLGLTGAAFTAAFAATVAVGAFLINMAIPPTAGKLEGGSDSDGQSYGYDGAKNTAREGVYVPIVYGEFRVAGNYIDVYTQNIGDVQYLYGRTVLSDGEVDTVSQPILNDQPISNYLNVEYGWTKGLLTEPINTRFGRSIAQYQRSAKLDNPSVWTTYTTTDEVDGFQLNFIFPMGLIEYNGDGSRSPEDSVIEIQYRQYGTSTWTAPGIPSTGGTGGTSGGYGGFGGNWAGGGSGGIGGTVYRPWDTP